MLFKDFSCSSDTTLQGKEDLGILKLMNVDWASIISVGYHGSIQIDAKKDLGNIGDDIPLEFIEKYKHEFLSQSEPYSTYLYKNINFVKFFIRKDETYEVFYIFSKKGESFTEDNLKWFNIYNDKAYNWLLLNNELIQNNDYITNVLDSTLSSIIVFDLNFNIISFNNMAESSLMSNSKNNCSTVYDLPFNHIKEIEAAIKEVIRTEKKKILNGMTLSLENADKIFTITFSPLRNSKMKVSGVVAVGTDISEIQFLRYELEHLERYRQIGEISLGISHDIKNPLMVIQSCANHIQKYSPERKEEDKLLNYIIQEVERINAVIDQLLSYGNVSKYNSYSYLNINDILLDCKQIVERQKMFRDIKVSINLYENLPSFRAENRDIYQIFLNIMGNAVQAIDKDGYIDITSEYLHNSNTISVKISDNGCGIKETDLSKIFTPYYTTKSNGRGLGLYLVKKTLARYNGNLDIKSEFNKGTTCTISLPYND